MPIIRQEGKDTIIFASKEDHASPSKVELPEPEPSPGLLLANGEINWNCPCLGGMATGPCGLEFREAFSCFHYSGAEPKGSDCYEAFKTMQSCMSQYPALYGNKAADISDMDDDVNTVEEHDSQQNAVDNANRKKEAMELEEQREEAKSESRMQEASTEKNLERSKAK